MNDGLHLEKKGLDTDSLHLHAPDLPLALQQHPHYGLASRALGKSPQIWTVKDGHQPVAQMQVASNRFMGLAQVTAILRGPRFLTAPDSALEAATYALLRRQTSLWRWRPCIIMPEIARTDALKAARLTRIMTGYATLWLDLSDDLGSLRGRLDGKWRNQLKKAEKTGLDAQSSQSAGAGYRWLLEQEASQQSARGYTALPTGFLGLYRDGGGQTLSLVVSQGREKLAGAVFLLHGTSSTYHIGYVSDSGRALNAMNLVLYQGIKALKGAGIRFLDMGGLNTGPMAGIARFKLGLDGLRARDPFGVTDDGRWPILLPGSFV